MLLKFLEISYFPLLCMKIKIKILTILWKCYYCSVFTSCMLSYIEFYVSIHLGKLIAVLFQWNFDRVLKLAIRCIEQKINYIFEIISVHCKINHFYCNTEMNGSQPVCRDYTSDCVAKTLIAFNIFVCSPVRNPLVIYFLYFSTDYLKKKLNNYFKIVSNTK